MLRPKVLPAHSVTVLSSHCPHIWVTDELLTCPSTAGPASEPWQHPCAGHNPYSSAAPAAAAGQAQLSLDRALPE